MSRRTQIDDPAVRNEIAAGNGLLNRRVFFSGGLFAAGAASIASSQTSDSIGVNAPAWMKTPGRDFSGYGFPAKSRGKVQREYPTGQVRPTTSSHTPLHLLEGTITPSGLHFERHHNGVPDIDPDRHELAIHGLGARPLESTG